MALPPVLDEENLYKFRTKICERYVKQGKCEFADKCQYSHDLRWTRRPPWKYTYSPELCRDILFVTDGRGRTIAKSNCKQKRNCRFAHTKEEQMYHPKIYKTALCHQCKENGWCDRYYCPFAHSEAELRHTDQSEESRKAFAKPAVQEALCPDIYLPSDRPHPRLRARFLAIMDGTAPQNYLHLTLEPSYLSTQGGARTRQPYTDFISSHTPHSVLSETSTPAQDYNNQQREAETTSVTVDAVPRNLESCAVGSRATKNSVHPLPASRHHSGGKDSLGEKRNHKATSRLVQLLQAKQFAGSNGEASGSKLTAPGPLQMEQHHQKLYAEGSRMGVGPAMTAISDAPPFASACASTQSAASAQQWGSMPASPSASRMPAFHTDYPKAEDFSGGPLRATFEGSVAAPFLPPLVQQGERQSKAMLQSSVRRGQSSGANLGPLPPTAGGLGALLTRAESWLGNQAKQHRGVPQPGVLASSTTWNKADRQPADQGQSLEVKTTVVKDFRVKCLASDICYWNEPIGRSRDDPSVLVYAGLILGPGKTREVVAVKQLPVVVVSRAGELWREVQRFTTISDPHLVNIKRALFLPGEADEGTSLWVVTEKCQGSIVDMFPAGAVSPSFLQAAFPPTGLNGLVNYLLRAIQTLHYRSQGAHMRIHPGNIMIGSHGEVKLGDCAGKIRYLSILDLLHAGFQGANNAKALLQWILGTPEETCWMAPEFLTSLVDLDEELSQALWQCGSSVDGGGNEMAFAEVARKFRWPDDFLKRADAWSAGATLFYIATGGLHPYGTVSDPLILANILADKKLNFDKLSNCPWLADLLAGLLSHKPSQRLSITQALHHPFFWTSEDIEKYLEDIRAALEPETQESTRLQDALSYSIHWVESLAYIASPVPLLPLLLSYMALPSAPPLLLAAHPLQSASSFLVFLALITGDKRIALAERRLIVSECLMAHATPFLHSVYLFLFPKLSTEWGKGVNAPVNTDTTANQAHNWRPPAAASTEGLRQITGPCVDPPLKSQPAFDRVGVAFPSRTRGHCVPSQSSHSMFREEVRGSFSDFCGSNQGVPPPPPDVAARAGMLREATNKPTEPLAGAQQRQPLRCPFMHGGSVLQGGNLAGQGAEAYSKTVTAGAERMAEATQRTALANNKVALQVQSLMKEINYLRPQQRAPGLRRARDTGNSEHIDAPDESPHDGARLAKEVAKKGSKGDAKQRASGAAKELRWACGEDRLSGAEEQTESRLASALGNIATSLWGPCDATVSGALELHASEKVQATRLREQLGASVQMAEAKEEAKLGSCGDQQVVLRSAAGERSSAASDGLQPCAEAAAQSARRLAGNAGPLRAYADEALGARKGAAAGQAEVKLSLGAGSALLQVPVVVSSVSTAHSSATASDFCNAQSQPTDGAGEGGIWKHELQPSCTDGSLKEAVGPQGAEASGIGGEEGSKLDDKATDAVAAKQAAAVDGLCQSAGGAVDLQRDASHACSIQ